MKNFIPFVIFAFVSLPACADTPSSVRQKFYEIDKAAALGEFGDTEKSACLQAFQGRYQQRVQRDGDLAFSDRVSETIYDRLFWNGDSSLRRGVAFTAPVSSGERHGTLICTYAITDHRLAFQNAFVLPIDSSQIASNR